MLLLPGRASRPALRSGSPLPIAGTTTTSLPTPSIPLREGSPRIPRATTAQRITRSLPPPRTGITRIFTVTTFTRFNRLPLMRHKMKI